jgi:hypothetical protein
MGQKLGIPRLDYPDPDEGYTLSVVTKETSFGAGMKGTSFIRFDFNQRKDKISETTIKSAPSPDEFIVIHSAEEIDSILSGKNIFKTEDTCSKGHAYGSDAGKFSDCEECNKYRTCIVDTVDKAF